MEVGQAGHSLECVLLLRIGRVPGIGYGADCKSVVCGFESHPDLQYNGAVAQLVEQRTHIPCVVGSIPTSTTK